MSLLSAHSYFRALSVPQAGLGAPAGLESCLAQLVPEASTRALPQRQRWGLSGGPDRTRGLRGGTAHV